MATTMATPREMSDAHCAFMRTPPSRTNSDSSGSTAKMDERPSEFDTGSSTCLYIALPPGPRHTGLPGRGLPRARTRQTRADGVAAGVHAPQWTDAGQAVVVSREARD